MAKNGEDNPVTKGFGDSLGGIETEGEPGFGRFGPIIDVEKFKSDYLFGIPLTSSLTGETVTDESLKRFIKKGIGDFETATRISVNPIRCTDRFDFERADDLRFGTKKLTRFPVLKVESLAALWPGRSDAVAAHDPSSAQEVSYPTDWVTLLGDTGLVRVVPTSGSFVNADASFLASTAYRSVVLGGMKSWPNMWRITYIAGFEADKVPDIVNDLIGVLAAHRLLSMIGPVIFPYAGHAIGLDGMSQSVSTAGPQWLQLRLKDLEEERDRLINQLKTHYNTDISFAAF